MRETAGFTLIELMIVIVIIGVISTVALLSTRGPDPGRVLAREADRLVLCIDQAIEVAVAGPRHLGLRLDPTHYGFRIYRAGRWEKLSHPPCRDHAWPPGLRWRTEVEGRRLPTVGGDAQTPQIYLLGSGEVSPFRIELEQSGVRWIVTGTGWGEVRRQLAGP
ncbi:MAG: type II secretion system minor pseudopilin GspH [Pseudomonadota bacterium]|nr:type II secretion system minor pseudopilin GspH [Pseudomonadota bacterium]